MERESWNAVDLETLSRGSVLLYFFDGHGMPEMYQSLALGFQNLDFSASSTENVWIQKTLGVRTLLVLFVLVPV